MADYYLIIDGPEIAIVGVGEQAVVQDLDFFDTTDIISGVLNSSYLSFEINGDIFLNLTGYAGVSGFSNIALGSATGVTSATIGQDFFDANDFNGLMFINGSAGLSVVLDASGLGAGSSVFLQSAGATNDVLTGGSGDDYLAGEGGADELNGGDGFDAARYNNASSGVTVNLATGTGTGGDALGDTFNSIERVDGSTFNDVLTGDAGDNVLYGGDGDDQLAGGDGADALIGANGTDTADYSSSDAFVSVSLADGVGFGGDAEGDTLDDIEDLIGSAFDDVLIGAAGVNFIDGRAGDDLLEGGASADTLQGGADTDTVTYANSGAAVQINMVTGDNTGGDALNDILSNIENVIGSDFDDTIVGDGGTNILTGNAGADSLNGGAGEDTMEGGTGTDTYFVDNAGDVVDETGGGIGGTDRVFSSVAVDLSDTDHFIGDVEGVQLLGLANLSLTGNALRNLLIGNQGDNIVDGGAGADSMWGRGGDDTYVVDNVGDLVDENLGGSYGTDLVLSSVTFNLGNTSQALGLVENLTLTGSSNINAIGSSRNNVLIGNDAANIVAGGAGNDTLTGGGANDVFLFNSTLNGASNVDTVTDMNEGGDDSIWLDNAIFTALTAGPLALQPLAAAAFVISSLGAIDGDDRIIYNSDNGQLSYDADGNGAGGSLVFAILDAGLSLTAADFRVV